MSMTIKDILDWSKHLEKEHTEKPPYWHLQQLRAILELQIKTKMSKEEKHNMAACMLSILDSLKLYDKSSLELGDETLSEMMFRKMKGYDIDLNKELGFTHLKPVTKPKQRR